MAIVYFDSSAFVKLVVEEDGSELAAALWDGCDAAVASRLAYPEVRAALAAAGRDHLLDAADQRRAEAQWEEFWSATRPVEITQTITMHAGELASAHALRGADAVHLASVLASRCRRHPARRLGQSAAHRSRGCWHPRCAR
ncbi:type II toxin-antitoxin system VapC family toxin [Arthrobacter dokdonensis]|uniref:type II toxin-antitoxin system VapC family toxin n=1 Tax=Arthrobacter dokdonellae TaxID=2211210 RepID=UPI001D131213|nr:type II toxin-antitoxin system VapC family toxin [Arthrobacter dokdonellae]